MRQPTPPLGKVARQVTARPTGMLQAPQTQAYIDPNSDRLVKGLTAFVDTLQGVQRQARNEAQDAQAVTADLGMRSYQQAWKTAVQTDPAILDDEQKRKQWDEDARSRYFADVSDEQIKGKAFQALESFVGSDVDTHQTVKAAKYRMDQASEHILATLGQVASASASEEDKAKALREEIEFFKQSPSYSLTGPQVEEALLAMVDSVDRNQAAVLAKAYMEDDAISPSSRLFLQAQHSKATAETEVEKQQRKNEFFQQTEPLINAGRLTSDLTDDAVAKGTITATEARSMHRRHQQRLEAEIAKHKDSAAFFRALNSGDLEQVTAFKLAEPTKFKEGWAAMREEYRQRGQLREYFVQAAQIGEPDEHTRQIMARGAASARGPVSSAEDIPQAFRYANEVYGKTLYDTDLTFSVLPPAEALKSASYQAARTVLGMDEVEAYNLMQGQNFAQFLNLNSRENRELQQKVRSALSSVWSSGKAIGNDNPNDIVGAMSAITALTAKATGLSAEEAVKQTVARLEKTVTATPYGLIPHSVYRGHVTEDALNKRLETAASNLVAEKPELEKDRLRVSMTPDGRVLFFERDSLTPEGIIHINDILAEGDGSLEQQRIENALEQEITAQARAQRNRDIQRAAFPGP